jgi:hypothetical protein
MAVTYGAGSNTILMSAALDAVTGLKKIRDIRWIKPAAAGDDISVTNTAGEVICNMTASAANADQSREIRQWHDGVILAVRDSGSLEVVLE